jgi:hypothetical protein
MVNFQGVFFFNQNSYFYNVRSLSSAQVKNFNFHVGWFSSKITHFYKIGYLSSGKVNGKTYRHASNMEDGKKTCHRLSVTKCAPTKSIL